MTTPDRTYDVYVAIGGSWIPAHLHEPTPIEENPHQPPTKVTGLTVTEEVPA